jgi:hypothetical protein
VAAARGPGGWSPRRTRALAVALAVGAVAATWLLSGVPPGEAVRFAAYEAAYAVLPGCVLYALLAGPGGGWLRAAAIGVPLGFALNVGVFALTAALDARAAFAWLPAVAVVAAGPLLWRRRRHARAAVAGPRAERARAATEGSPPAQRSADAGASRWGAPAGGPAPAEGGAPAQRPTGTDARGWDAVVVAGAIAGALTILAFTFFASTPLPPRAQSVAYGSDNVFDIALVAEARNHWPITEPWVAGQPLRYYTGVFIHAAGAEQVAGVAPATLVLRLLPATMFVVVALQLWFLGASLGRSPWVGPLAAVLLLVAEDVNLNPTRSHLSYVNPFTQFPLSPTFAFGVPFLLGLLALLGPRFGAAAEGGHGVRWGPRRAGDTGVLAAAAILVTGAAAAKTFAAADALGALSLYWLWCLGARRPLRLPTLSLACAAAGTAAVYVALLTNGGASDVTVSPLDFLSSGHTFERARSLAEGAAGHLLYWLPLLLGAVVLAALLLAPLAGCVWLAWRRIPLPPAGGLAAAVGLTGALAYVLVGAPYGVEGVFLVYGYIAATPLAAYGAVRLWAELPVAVRGPLARACAALLAAGLVLAAATTALALRGRAGEAWSVAAYGALAAGVALTVWRLRGGCAATIRSRTGSALACAIPPLVVLGLVKPATLVGARAWRTARGESNSLANSAHEYGLTAPLYRGLEWVRAHTGPCAVLAVSNHYTAPDRGGSPAYVYYSALTERRVFLESWTYTPLGALGGEPFPRRLALNERAVADGDPAALAELARDGVRDVLVDRVHGGGAAEPPSVSRLVYASPALDVYRLRVPVGSPPAECGTVRWSGAGARR